MDARGAEARRLVQVERALAGVGNPWESAPLRRARARSWLLAQDGPAADPWIRTAMLEEELVAGSQGGDPKDRVDAQDFAWLERGRLVSAAPWMVLARASYAGDPASGLAYSRRASALDPRDGEALLVQAACLRALGDPSAQAASDAWVRLRDEGGWRHTE